MTAAAPTVALYTFAHLAQFVVVDATGLPARRDEVKLEEQRYASTFVGDASWAGRAGYEGSTATAERGVFVVNADRPGDGLISSVLDLIELNAGWDGERAAAPMACAVVDAVRFVSVAGGLAAGLEPTLHVDGSVILELDDGAAGSLRFRGDGTIVNALRGAMPGVVTFDGYTVPEAIGAALRS